MELHRELGRQTAITQVGELPRLMISYLFAKKNTSPVSIRKRKEGKPNSNQVVGNGFKTHKQNLMTMKPIQIYRAHFSKMGPQSLTHIMDRQADKFQIQISFFPHFSEAASFWLFWSFGLKRESKQFSYPALYFQTLLRKLWVETHHAGAVPQTALEWLNLFPAGPQGFQVV